jgi:tripartite-type tricarboxylate transporter receptor subunit TctC
MPGKSSFRLCGVASLSLAVGSLWSPVAGAQGAASFPSQSMRIIVGTSPGGALDATARAIGNSLAQVLGQQVLVDNRAGASGALAYEQLIKAPADGHTMLTVSATHVVNSLVIPGWPYQTSKVTEPLSQVASLYYIIYRHPSVPTKTLKELLAYARQHPGKVMYGTGGMANISHLGWEWLAHMSGTRFKHVAYKGASNAVKATIAGEMHVGFSTVHSLRHHFAAGRAHPLAVTSRERLAALPEVPAVAEFGYPDYEVNQWYGIATNANVPADIVAKLSSAIVDAVKSPEVRKRLESDGSVVVGSSREAFRKHLEDEQIQWRKILQDTGVTLSGAKLK